MFTPKRWVASGGSLIDPVTYHDPENYTRDTDVICGRSWQFVGIAGHVSTRADFLPSHMEPDEVLITRDGDNVLRVMPAAAWSRPSGSSATGIASRPWALNKNAGDWRGGTKHSPPCQRGLRRGPHEP